MPRKRKVQIATPPGSLADEQAESYIAPVKAPEATAMSSKDMLRTIADLQERLAASEEARTEAEQKAIESAALQGLIMPSEVMEIPTGKKRPLRVLDLSYTDEDGYRGYKCKGYKDDQGGRPILQPVFKTEQVPTFYYKIDLPASGGEFIRINELQYYHGTVIEVDLHLLRSVKDICYRSWAHERSIKGSNENAYRREKRPVISARA